MQNDSQFFGNLVAFGAQLTQRAAVPQNTADQELADFLSTAEDTAENREKFFHAYIEQKKFFDKQNDARIWSDALFKNLTQRRKAGAAFAAMVLNMPHITQETLAAVEQNAPGVGTEQMPSVPVHHDFSVQPRSANQEHFNVRQAKEKTMLRRTIPQVSVGGSGKGKDAQASQAEQSQNDYRPQPMQRTQNTQSAQQPAAPNKKKLGLAHLASGLLAAGALSTGVVGVYIGAIQ